MATASRCLLTSRLFISHRYSNIKILTTRNNSQKRFHSTLRYQILDRRRFNADQVYRLNCVYRITTFRNITTESNSNETSTDISEPYIPEPPTPPVQLPDEVLVETAQVMVGEPSLASLGLAHWTPPGLIQSGLEWLHIGLDLPWWGALVAGTLIVRICLFPLVILAQRNAAKMNNNLPQMQILQMKMSEARRQGNHFEAAKYGHELMTFMKEKQMNPLKSMIVPLAQAPVFISFFIGLRKMANLPVVSMKTGGLAWFTDLTVADPYYILPIVTSATLFASLELGAEGGMRTDNMKMMRYVFRALPIVIFPFIMNFPTAMVWYWAVSNFITLIQVAILRIPAVRDYFKIERLIRHSSDNLPMSKKSLTDSFRESMTNSKIAREIQERERIDEIQFRKAGMGPIQKTYPYDPTKQTDKKNTGPIEAKSTKQN